MATPEALEILEGKEEGRGVAGLVREGNAQAGAGGWWTQAARSEEKLPPGSLRV